MIDAVLKEIRQRGLSPVPCEPLSKQPRAGVLDWDKKYWQDPEFRPNDNIGTILQQSKTIHVDADNRQSEHFCGIWLPQDTLIIGRSHKIGKVDINVKTNYLYRNNGTLKENQRLSHNGKVVMEFRCKGQTIVYGKTPYKENKDILCERYIANDAPIKSAPDNLQFLVNKVYVASVLCEYAVGANLGALKLDSCIKRYCNWSDSEREDFVWQIVQRTDGQSRDCTKKKMENHVRSNNKETKNSGYISFATHIGADKVLVKNLFKMIGSVPSDDEYEVVKSIVDFNEKAINVKDLMQELIPPLKWSVLPILPEGFGVISGRPKGMKSWTALGICYAVQNGTKFMGHETTQGDCLYLALEDSKRRIKDRIIKLGYQKLNPPTILLASDVPYLGFGFEECVQEWINSKDNPRLIIIDTLARIRPRARKSSGTAYDIDNELLSKIQTIAIQNNITIACISHLSKAQQEYNFDRIQGSVGVQGISDFMWLIDRGDNSNQASIIGRGRDMNDFEYAVKWNEDKWQYDFTGNLQMVQLTENRRQVIDAMNILSKEKDEIAPRDVCKYYEVSVQSKDGKRISKTMQRMEGDFELIKGQKFGTYKLPNKTEL